MHPCQSGDTASGACVVHDLLVRQKASRRAPTVLGCTYFEVGCRGSIAWLFRIQICAGDCGGAGLHERLLSSDESKNVDRDDTNPSGRRQLKNGQSLVFPIYVDVNGFATHTSVMYRRNNFYQVLSVFFLSWFIFPGSLISRLV